MLGAPEKVAYNFKTLAKKLSKQQGDYYNSKVAEGPS